MKKFWKDKKVFITGHTGFKGSWLTMWLHSLGAKVYGYSLNPTSSPSLYELAGVKNLTENTYIEDIKDLSRLKKSLEEVQPEIILHLAAQALVIEGYENPVDTYMTNVMGTVHVLEAARNVSSVKAIVNVTTDKCYENREWVWSYRENDRLGGFDPYSNSKACSELVTSAYINSFYPISEYKNHGVAIATARAGNVIGGGDWANNRLIPDIVNAIINKEELHLRNPNAVRPWQHVLEPLSGYLRLAENLYTQGIEYSGAWNFGPDEKDCKDVKWIVTKLIKCWGSSTSVKEYSNSDYHEANLLKLDCSKARERLHWEPQWDLENALQAIVDWNQSFMKEEVALDCCLQQILQYENGKFQGNI